MTHLVFRPAIALGLLAFCIFQIVTVIGQGHYGEALTAGIGQTSLYTLGIITSLLCSVWALRTLWRVSFRRFKWSKSLGKAPISAWFGIFIVLLFTVMGVFAPVIAPYGEKEIVGAAYAVPDALHLFGTDQVGRDVWSRIIFGARNTIGIAMITTLIAFFIGSILGMLAATVGGKVDQALSRIVDLLMAIPQLIFALLVLSILGTGLINLILVIAVLDSTRVYRLSRAVTQGIASMDYIEAAKLRGEGIIFLLCKEILPNALAPLIAEFGMRLSFVLLTIAALSFLGLGIQPPMADWASMVAENKLMITFGVVTPLIPGLFIALLTVSINLIVDWKLHQASGLKE